MLTGWIGVLTAGFLGGSFAVPARRLRAMSWDGAWLIYSVVAQILMPCLLGVLFAAPLFSRVFPEHGPLVGYVMLAGALWGCGTFLFGSCIPRLGLATTNAVVSGTVALVGSLSPLWVGAAQIAEDDLGLLIAGLSTLAAGIAASGRAALLRDRAAAQPNEEARQPAAGSVLTAAPAGVLLALLSGFLSSMLNAGFVYGQPLMKLAAEHGVDAAFTSLAVWIPLLGGGFLVNALATNVRLLKSGEHGRMVRAPRSDWLRAMSMGLLWASALLTYGASVQHLGRAGLVYGWALASGTSLLVATFWGLSLGEWKGASARTKSWLWAGLILILFSLFLLSTGKPVDQAESLAPALEAPG